MRLPPYLDMSFCHVPDLFHKSWRVGAAFCGARTNSFGVELFVQFEFLPAAFSRKCSESFQRAMRLFLPDEPQKADALRLDALMIVGLYLFLGGVLILDYVWA